MATIGLLQTLAFILATRKQTNAVDTEKYEDDWAANSKNWFVDADADKWKTTSIMGGIHFLFPFIGNKVALELKGMVGAAFSISPAIDVFAEYPVDNWSYDIEQAESKASALCYLFGGGLKINVSKRIGITLNADYFITTPKFKDVEKRSKYSFRTFNSNIRRSEGEFDQPIKTINVGAGVTFF